MFSPSRSERHIYLAESKLVGWLVDSYAVSVTVQAVRERCYA
jgi:hypothetical protein